METWNKRISARREEMGLSKSEFARRCGVSAPTVNDWENGDIKELSGPKLLKICEALSLDPWEVLAGKPRANPPKREVNQPLSDEAELLIQCVLRNDSQSDLVRKTFALHADLLNISLSQYLSHDSTTGHELLEQAEREAEALLTNTLHSGVKHAANKRRRG